MFTNCERVLKLTIPALRISASCKLRDRYDLNQVEIAKRVGIAQAAVSKYLNGRYTERIGKVRRIVEEMGLDDPIVKALAGSNQGRKQASAMIDAASLDPKLVERTLRVLKLSASVPE
jgi:predicted transcriptional regulator